MQSRGPKTLRSCHHSGLCNDDWDKELEDFIRNFKNEKAKENFDEELINNIKNEIRDLGSKIAKIRLYNDNGSEYKNLMQAYINAIELYQNIKKDLGNRPNFQNNTNPDIYFYEEDSYVFKAKKKLTPTNHLLFFNGSLVTLGLQYEISDDTAIFTFKINGRKEDFVDTVRIVWLSETN